ncbi:MAG: ABC transporter substrate-binding protein [Fimbriimonadaceae bacterium]|nr:ABC transporter substrate-binding protein [Fimbriimonadaceae bacterium]
MRRYLSWLPVAAVAFALVGCNPQPNVIIGGKDGPRYERIVSLSPSATELIARYANWRKMKGRTQACDYPSYVSSVPVVASVKPDYEKIAEIKPDFIVYDADLYSEQDVERIKQLGAKEVFVFKANTIADFKKEVMLFAAQVAGESNASKYVDQITNAEETAASDALPKKPRAVILMGNPGAYWAAGKGSLMADIVAKAGGELVGPEGSRYAPVNTEALIGMNPDVILVVGGSADEGMLAVEVKANEKVPDTAPKPVSKGEEAEPVLKDPQLQSTAAVKNKYVYGLAADVATRRGSRVNDLIDAMHTLMARVAKGEQ